MRSKYITSFLALFGFGIHRFYLDDRRNAFLYLVLTFTGIGYLAQIIDFFVFLFMDKETFDRKYNGVNSDGRDYERRSVREYESRRERRRKRHQPENRKQKRRERQRERPSTVNRATRVTRTQSKAQVHIKAGKEHYAGFDYFEAIAQWSKAIELEPKNAAVHYNLACTFSLTEQADKAFYHLSEAVKFGFDNFEKLNEQDALAFLRIQKEFDDFAANGYLLEPPKGSVETSSPEEPSSEFLSKDILEQLKELGDLRERGILTEEEFIAQKKKLI